MTQQVSTAGHMGLLVGGVGWVGGLGSCGRAGPGPWSWLCSGVAVWWDGAVHKGWAVLEFCSQMAEACREGCFESAVGMCMTESWEWSAPVQTA